MSAEDGSEASRPHVLATLYAMRDSLDALIFDKTALASIERGAQLLCATFARGGRVYCCGSGRSMSDAMQFADQLMSRQGGQLAGLPVQAISDIAQVSRLANRLGYDKVFSRYVLAHGREGDCLVAISKSGKSTAAINAAVSARDRGMSVLAITAAPTSELLLLSDVGITTGAASSARARDLQPIVLHLLVELVERTLFPDAFASRTDVTRLMSG